MDVTVILNSGVKIEQPDYLLNKEDLLKAIKSKTEEWITFGLNTNITIPIKIRDISALIIKDETTRKVEIKEETKPIVKEPEKEPGKTVV